MNRFVDDNNNKRDEDYLSIFNCFLSTAETFVFICVKLTFISRLRKYLIGYRWSFNTRDTIMSVERQTFCKGRKCGVLPDNSYIRLFKTVLTETNHEWHEARIIIFFFLIDDRCELFIYKWLTEVRTASSSYSLSNI